MMTTDRLAELYKKVLQLEERFEAIERKAKNLPKTDAIALQERRRRVAEAKDALATARKEFSDAISSYNRIHSMIPFYRRSKIYSVKLETRTVKFRFDQHGIPTIL